MSDLPQVRFVRTPSGPSADIAALLGDGGDALYLAHSVPSKRNAPDGVSFVEILRDHEEQADADEIDACTPWEAAFHLVRCIEIGLVSTVRARAYSLHL